MVFYSPCCPLFLVIRAVLSTSILHVNLHQWPSAPLSLFPLRTKNLSLFSNRHSVGRHRLAVLDTTPLSQRALARTFPPTLLLLYQIASPFENAHQLPSQPLQAHPSRPKVNHRSSQLPRSLSQTWTSRSSSILSCSSSRSILSQCRWLLPVLPALSVLLHGAAKRCQSMVGIRKFGEAVL